MTDVEALRIALTRETASIELYGSFAVEQPHLKDTFLFLLNEEEKHKQLIEKKISEMTRI